MVVSKKEKNLQFPYVVQAQYEQRTARFMLPIMWLTACAIS